MNSYVLYVIGSHNPDKFIVFAETGEQAKDKLVQQYPCLKKSDLGCTKAGGDVVHVTFALVYNGRQY